MVVEKDNELWADRAFHALSDATRRDMMTRCVRNSPSISTLALAYPMSFAAVQKHVTVLERAGLVSKQRRGREQLVVAERSGLRRASELLGEFEQLWRGRLDRFDDLLQSDTESGH